MYATMIECIRTILSEYNNPAVWFISSSAQICEPPVNPSEARCFSGRFTKNQQPRETSMSCVSSVSEIVDQQAGDQDLGFETIKTTQLAAGDAT